MKTKKIPDFKTIQEEAEFWDTHDVTDYLSEMNFVNIEFLPRNKKEEVITVRLESELKERMELLARSKGINISSLARMSIIEKLKNESQKHV